MDKRFLGILAAIIIVFIGIFAITQNSNSSSSGGNNKSSSQTTHHVQGRGSSGVTLQEYGDYECPICEAYYLPLKQAVAKYNSQIYFQFSNLPLTAIHQNAFAGARAAEASSQQNKFWQMHDKLYDNQNEWASNPNPLSVFTNYAQQLGLNVDQFKTDYASSKVNDVINADLAAFKKTGKEQATPTFFINGKYVANTEFTDPQTGQPSTDKISQFLQSEINKKSGSSSSSPSSSTPAAQTPSSSGNPY